MRVKRKATRRRGRTRTRSAWWHRLTTTQPTAEWLSWGVAAVLGLLVLSFEVTDPWDPPMRGRGVWKLLWAAAHRPTFYPLVAAAIAGPVLTALAWRRRGVHRGALVAAWLTAGAWLGLRHGERLSLMVEVLWWRVTS